MIRASFILISVDVEFCILIVYRIPLLNATIKSRIANTGDSIQWNDTVEGVWTIKLDISSSLGNAVSRGTIGRERRIEQDTSVLVSVILEKHSVGEFTRVAADEMNFDWHPWNPSNTAWGFVLNNEVSSILWIVFHVDQLCEVLIS